MIKKLHIKNGLTLTECGRRHEEEGLLSADQGDKWAIEPAAVRMRICPACVRMVRNTCRPKPTDGSGCPVMTWPRVCALGS